MRILLSVFLIILLQANCFAVIGYREKPVLKTEPYTGLTRQEGQFYELSETPTVMTVVPNGDGWFHVQGSLTTSGILLIGGKKVFTSSGRGEWQSGAQSVTGAKIVFSRCPD